MFHVISWSSRKLKRPAKSIACAETLAAGDAIDEDKLIVKALNELLNLNIGLWIAVDWKELFSTMSSCRLGTDRSIRGDVSLIRFEFAKKTISQMIWVPENINLADPGTKTHCNLSQSLQLLLSTGKIPFHFNEAIIQSSYQFKG